MEKVAGVELSRIWDKIKVRKRIEIVKQVAAITRRLAGQHFTSYGSMYYCQDIEHLKECVIDEEFVVGPTTARSWFDNRRSQVDTDRGPCKCLQSISSLSLPY